MASCVRRDQDTLVVDLHEALIAHDVHGLTGQPDRSLVTHRRETDRPIGATRRVAAGGMPAAVSDTGTSTDGLTGSIFASLNRSQGGTIPID